MHIHRDLIAGKLDEMADLCECWKRHRERGSMPNAIRAALCMLSEEVRILQEQENGQFASDLAQRLVKRESPCK